MDITSLIKTVESISYEEALLVQLCVQCRLNRTEPQYLSATEVYELTRISGHEDSHRLRFLHIYRQTRPPEQPRPGLQDCIDAFNYAATTVSKNLDKEHQCSI